KLIKRYLDIAFGDNRLYLHDDAIYTSSSKDNYLQTCMRNICNIFPQGEKDEPDDFWLPLTHKSPTKENGDKLFILQNFQSSDIEGSDTEIKDINSHIEFKNVEIASANDELLEKENEEIQNFLNNAIF